MNSSEIRNKFLEFFRARDHRIQPSASLVPADPTMLLTGAGMVPFKPIFLGKAQVDYTRAASVQKCVRTTDIELIGLTGRHLSFFEMLGNFSFGDYYKREAISWAWELLTDVFKLDRSKLWVTVFETDDEAAEIWETEIGLPAERIVRMGAKDNFWSAGPTGPCGPSSEILFDQGPEAGCAKPDCAVGCDCDRYLEIWNLVFMQYNRDESGELHPLPRKNIDTGMGLERIASVLQGVTNNYDTDLIRPVIEAVNSLAPAKYGDAEKSDISFRIIADHCRAVTFMIGDGILPGNDGRGYILRRLIRRSVRHARLLGIERIFLASLIDIIGDIMADAYPEVKQNLDFIKTVAAKEEERFGHTLRQGLSILGETMSEIKQAGGAELSGEAAFKLYDTYGFPLELTGEIAVESGLTVDKAGFDKLMREQRERAREKAPGVHAELYVSTIYHQVKEQIGPTEFVGYETDACEAKLAALSAGDQIKMEASEGEKVEVFLDRTPFYAEKGGQVGDKGVVTTDSGKIRVDDTVAPVADLVAHRGEVVQGAVRLGQTATVEVDSRRRRAISRNHTATHLLHWALRTTLGQQVKQAGSLVETDRLRFDFTYHEPLTAEQIKTVERLVNDKILQNQPVRAFETTFDFAKESGALAFFGEKYGRFVRLVEIGNFSKELCGGVHVHNISEVGYVKITGESGIGANTRRIEAITGERFLRRMEELEGRLAEAASIIKAAPTQLVPAVESLAARFQEQEKELVGLKAEKLAMEAERIAGAGEEIDGVSLFTAQVPGADVDSLREVADRLRGRAGKAAVVLASARDGKALVLIAATPQLVKIGFDSAAMVAKVAPLIRGGGGGRADMAQAGGKDAGNFPAVFEEAKSFVNKLLEKENV